MTKNDGFGLAHSGKVIFILFLILASCQVMSEKSRVALPFAELCGLGNDQFGVMDTNATRQWIVQKYGQSAMDKQVTEMEGGVSVYQWHVGKTSGSAYLRDGRLLRISYFDIENGPTFGEIVKRLGPPEFLYRDYVAYEQVLYHIGLDYPALGIYVESYRLVDFQEIEREDKLVVPLSENMKLSGIDCFTPSNSMEEVLRNPFMGSSQSVQIQMQRRMPWPGFGALIVLDSRP